MTDVARVHDGAEPCPKQERGVTVTENGFLFGIDSAFGLFYDSMKPIQMPLVENPYGTNSTMKSEDISQPARKKKRLKKCDEEENKYEVEMRDRHLAIRDIILAEQIKFLSKWNSICLDTIDSTDSKDAIKAVNVNDVQGCEIIPWLDLANAVHGSEETSTKDKMARISECCNVVMKKKVGLHPFQRYIPSFVLDDPDIIFNNLLLNDGDECFVESLNNTFVVPKNCAFQISDISKINIISENLGSKSRNQGFRFIVIDFPWENRSQKRSGKYKSLPNYDAFKIPVKELASENGCVVALWCTNSGRLNDFVVTKLMPFWGVDFVGIWYWLKLTTKCELVSDLDSPHRKPYEALLIGITGSKLTKQQQKNLSSLLKPPKIIGSIPTLHSRKPPLGQIFESLDLFSTERFSTTTEAANTTPKYKGIELFARNLVPDWVCWGNEVLKFQSIHYFEPKCS